MATQRYKGYLGVLLRQTTEKVNLPEAEFFTKKITDVKALQEHEIFPPDYYNQFAGRGECYLEIPKIYDKEGYYRYEELEYYLSPKELSDSNVKMFTDRQECKDFLSAIGHAYQSNFYTKSVMGLVYGVTLTNKIHLLWERTIW